MTLPNQMELSSLNVNAPDALSKRLTDIAGSKKLAENGRKLVEEGVLSTPGFPDAQVDLLSDWSADPFGSRSWQWRNASFNFIPSVIAYHAHGGGDRAIDFAIDALHSWNQAVRGYLRRYEFARHDHATARQAENLLFLLSYMVGHGLRPEGWPGIETAIQDHAELLVDEDFYSRHTNHGIEQARILAMIADFLPDHPQSPTRMALALQRLNAELTAAFTREGVHVENSPGYHSHVALSFIKMLDYFPRATLGELADRIDTLMPKAIRFLTHITRPDGTYPIIGDTQRSKVPNYFTRYAKSREFAHLRYALSDGSRGTPAPETVTLYPEAGYFIARDAWYPKGKGASAFHLIVRSGFRSSYHRHDDDLSLVLYCGEDWLLDSGAYSYAKRDPIREYVRSKWAHNVPVVMQPRSRRWERKPPPMSMPMQRLRPGDGAIAVRAISHGYPGHIAIRDVQVQPAEREFWVTDSMIQTSPLGRKRYLSLWHIPADKDVHIHDQQVEIVSRKTGNRLLIDNMGRKAKTIGLLDPKVEGLDGPVVSWTFNSMEQAQLLAYEWPGEQLQSLLRFRVLINGQGAA